MPRLIWVFAGRTVILLVLSCRGSDQYATYKHWKSLAASMTFDILGSRGNAAICLPRLVNWKQATEYESIIIGFLSYNIFCGPSQFVTIPNYYINSDLEKSVKKEWIFRVQTGTISHNKPWKCKHCHKCWVITIFGRKGFPSFWNALQFSKIITHEYVGSTFVSLRWDFMHLWYQCFPHRGAAGIPRELDQQKITSPRNLTEHFDTGTGPHIEILEEIMCKF